MFSGWLRNREYEAMSIVNVENLTHYFGDKLVFKEIEFRLLSQERVGLVGPNGAGKSTLIEILTGSIQPDKGSINWHPNVRVGYLEQHIDLTEGMDIRNYLRSAFKYLYEAENEMLEISSQMAFLEGADLEQLLKKFAQVQELLETNDFYMLDAKIEEIASGLGITALGMDTDVNQLSGGQRTKLLLAKLLLEEPEVLMLDEPTNYLDLEHIEWLKDYLKSYPNSFILISHDQSFMNEVVNVIYHLEHKQLTRYVGNFKKFEEAYELRKQQIFTAYNRQQAEIKKLETYIQKNKVRASTAKQAKEREKKLMKIDRIEKPSLSPRPKFSFSVCERPADVILEVEKVEVGYVTPLLPPFTFRLQRGEKVAITGYNGIGKSTTLKTMIGELTPLNGTVSIGQNVKPSYFTQEWNTTSEQSPLEFIWSLHTKMTQKEVLQALARSGLKTEHIYQPLTSLSGGEQTRVRLCQLMLEKSNLLILDEPTNHLDLQAKEALADALQRYEGTIVVVSHEPEFYRDWVTQVWDLEQWQIK